MNTPISIQPARQFCLKCLLMLLIIFGLTIISFIYLSLNPADLFTFEAMRNMA